MESSPPSLSPDLCSLSRFFSPHSHLALVIRDLASRVAVAGPPAGGREVRLFGARRVRPIDVVAAQNNGIMGLGKAHVVFLYSSYNIQCSDSTVTQVLP